ncbi:alpha/beta fold hydrolase [Rhodococcus rhodochrous]|uniref:Pimeloyl-ACP methyl ester carboxylesterase n=1 Tax=Rhodococcus rhodochrous J45 TaxID=935266 RepID=A0A562D802_RHORH|nr:alpha/beta fold hydrolase [Rhodococcus rhodochrous]MCB8914129.1 alpha/beta fold hydrolase [Rhodococcus rhodochrous]TWH05925.1 pimeloyl-ACP methyl ester carboxylesterase [Rhodococcus rhodochrous J45]
MNDRDVVLVHGGHHGAWCWDAVVESMRNLGYEGNIHTPDVPGCGSKRGRDTDRLRLIEIAEELNDELSGIDTRNALLVGHSMAGVILPLMVENRPALFSSACFLSTSIPRNGESILDLFGTELRGIDQTRIGWPESREAGLEKFFAAMFAPDMTPEQFDVVLKNALEDSWPACASAEAVYRSGFPGSFSVSFIVTERDPILPPAWQGRFAERLGVTRLYSIDTPHEPFITHPDLLAEILVKTARTN